MQVFREKIYKPIGVEPIFWAIEEGLQQIGDAPISSLGADLRPQTETSRWWWRSTSGHENSNTNIDSVVTRVSTIYSDVLKEALESTPWQRLCYLQDTITDFKGALAKLKVHDRTVTDTGDEFSILDSKIEEMDAKCNVLAQKISHAINEKLKKKVEPFQELPVQGIGDAELLAVDDFILKVKPKTGAVGVTHYPKDDVLPLDVVFARGEIWVQFTSDEEHALFVEWSQGHVLAVAGEWQKNMEGIFSVDVSRPEVQSVSHAVKSVIYLLKAAIFCDTHLDQFPHTRLVSVTAPCQGSAPTYHMVENERFNTGTFVNCCRKELRDCLRIEDANPSKLLEEVSCSEYYLAQMQDCLISWTTKEKTALLMEEEREFIRRLPQSVMTERLGSLQSCIAEMALESSSAAAALEAYQRATSHINTYTALLNGEELDRAIQEEVQICFEVIAFLSNSLNSQHFEAIQVRQQVLEGAWPDLTDWVEGTAPSMAEVARWHFIIQRAKPTPGTSLPSERVTSKPLATGVRNSLTLIPLHTDRKKNWEVMLPLGRYQRGGANREVQAVFLWHEKRVVCVKKGTPQKIREEFNALRDTGGFTASRIGTYPQDEKVSWIFTTLVPGRNLEIVTGTEGLSEEVKLGLMVQLATLVKELHFTYYHVLGDLSARHFVYSSSGITFVGTDSLFHTTAGSRFQRTNWEHMAPELWEVAPREGALTWDEFTESRSLSVESDIYLLGVLFWQIFSNSKDPFPFTKHYQDFQSSLEKARSEAKRESIGRGGEAGLRREKEFVLIEERTAFMRGITAKPGSLYPLFNRTVLQVTSDALASLTGAKASFPVFLNGLLERMFDPDPRTRITPDALFISLTSYAS